MNNCRGQGYDGAGNMSGKNKGSRLGLQPNLTSHFIFIAKPISQTFAL